MGDDVVCGEEEGSKDFAQVSSDDGFGILVGV